GCGPGPGSLPGYHRATQRDDRDGEPRARPGRDRDRGTAGGDMSDDGRARSNGRSMSVLVVDDEEPFRLLMERRLGGPPHQVECVPSAEAALDRLGARTFAVVLLDLRMPGMGGLDALRRIHDAHLPCQD